ncbi:MAG: proline dehydrogenase family protein [Chloroflexia bacterium]|nr:proline dehydrogenase family protein [Chloroflexia bacterium]
MNIMRRTVLAVADNARVAGFFRSSRLARKLVSRFVAGETVETALAAAKDLDARNITTTLDLLGENVSTAGEAAAAVESYTAILRAMRAANLEPNISVKLTMLGLDFGAEIARANAAAILDVAREVGGFVRIDMEGSAYTAVTMEVFEALHAAWPDEAGIVIQSYLRRAEADVRRAIELGARVRLVKGAYAEPESVAFTSRLEVDEQFARLARLLLDEGHYPAIATHDLDLVRATIEHAQRYRIASERFEFQMLYGVRRDLQDRLVTDGYRMRVYVPYGTEWYPYFTRRIAERPANALFVVRQLWD